MKAVFTIFCPYLKIDVTLKEETWYYKIIKEHPEVKNRLSLVKEILSKDQKGILRYRKKQDPFRIAVFKECPHFLPYNRYLKIALRLINKKESVITTVHSQYNLPGSNMEEIK